MVTPLLGRDQLDVEGLERLIEHILSGGVHGLFALGTTGEAPSLGYRLRRELIDRVCKQVNGRVPVFIGVTDTSFVESITLAEHAATAGASAVVIAPPYYFPAGQPELADYFTDIVNEMPLPVVLYNMPGCTKINFELDTLSMLFKHPNIIAIKDSSGQMHYYHSVIRMLREFPDKTVLIGPEEMLAEATLLGGNGGVSGGANLFPQLYVELYNAAIRQDIQTVNTLHRSVIEVSSLLYRVGRHGSSTIKGIKCALSCMDICSDVMAEPFGKFIEPERAVIEKHLAQLDDMILSQQH